MRKILFLATLAIVTLTTACQESLEEQAARQARRFTEERCPMRMQGLTLDSMVFSVPTRTLTRYYRLTGAADHDGLDATLLKRALIDELNNEPSYRVYRERGFNFRYEYCSERQPEKLLFETTLTPADYSH